MSNHLAIATVTATLFNILDAGKEEAGTSITTLPPDKARDNGSGNQVNLFLYHTAINSAWRNMDFPRQVKPGETGHPPLALTLYYLVTAYGASDDDIAAHRVLGRAMSNLHDHPLLGREEFQGANAQLAASDLHEQVERVRITPEPLSLDDMYKLWSSFQSQYRPSAAYQVSVVLIESERPAKTPLPVLSRSEGDTGAAAQADLIPPFPAVEGVTPPNAQPAARTGDAVLLAGHHLDGDSVDVVLRHPRAEDPIVRAPEAGSTDTELTVVLSGGDWMAGIYTVSAVIHRAGEPDRVTNELPLVLAPRLTSLPPDPVDLGSGNTLTVECEPAALKAQKPLLLLGDRQIAAKPFGDSSSSLDFRVTDENDEPLVEPGEHFIRLRVDGVDSLLVLDYTQRPPVFDPDQKATLNPA